MITPTSRTLIDGARNLVMQFTGVSDGAGGQESNVVKVDVSELTPACRFISIRGFDYEVSGGILQLLWGADDPVVFDNLAYAGERDYSRAPLVYTGGNGDILFSTLGFDVGSSYSIKLEMTKKF